MKWLTKIASKEYSPGTQAAVAAAKAAIAVAEAVLAAEGTSFSFFVNSDNSASSRKDEESESQLKAQKVLEQYAALLDKREQQIKESSEKLESAQKQLEDNQRGYRSQLSSLMDQADMVNRDRVEARRIQSSMEMTAMALANEKEKLRTSEKELSSKVAELDQWSAEIKDNFHRFTNDTVKMAKNKTNKVDREYAILIRNNDRYRSDTHRVSIYKSAHLEGISIALELKNERDGMLAYSDYWHYEDNENRIANRLFDKLVEISEDIKVNTEQLLIPVSLISPTFKTATINLDQPHREKSTAVNYNYRAEEPNETDWRETLYGPRYPYPKSPGVFRRHFAHTDESKFPVSDGDGRKKVYTYRYS